MKKLALFAAVAVLSASAAMNVAQAQQVYKIYDGAAPGSENADYPEIIMNNPAGHPMVYNVSEPTITVYRPDAAIDTGAAMIIAPGGGNRYLTWEEEGINVAQWLQHHGITGIILKYRTVFMGKDRDEVTKNVMDFWASLMQRSNEANTESAQPAPAVNTAPVQLQPTIQGDDGRQAMKYVRRHAKEWGIDPQRIGIMGFSAGGVVTMNVLMIHDEESKPNFAAPIYGVVSNPGVPADKVPVFLCSPTFDLTVPEYAEQFFNDLKNAQVPAELHYIYEGTHGDGLQYNGKEWNEWMDMLYRFMKATKFLEKE